MVRDERPIREFLDESSGAYIIANPPEKTIRISDGDRTVTLDVTPEKCTKLEHIVATMRERLINNQQAA